MKGKALLICICVLLCLLAGGSFFTAWQVWSFQAAMERIAETTGDFQLELAYKEGQDGQQQLVRLEGEKEGLRQMHVLYSDDTFSNVECYADLARSGLFVNGLSAVPGLQEFLPPETGVYFTLDQVESLLGEKLMDDQIRFYYSEDRIAALIDRILALPWPRFLLPEDLQKDAGNGKGYRIPGEKIWLVLEPADGDRPDRVLFFAAEENLQVKGSIKVTPDDGVQIVMPDPVSDRMFGLLKSGLDLLP